ncbi:MAG TPA: GNAT family N-acetyltransferase, partial [Alphaproteobacteria bacterium]
IADMRITHKDGYFTTKNGSQWPRVPQEKIWIVADGNFIGAINFRPVVHKMLENYGGHAGYSITPSARNKGYMTKALGLLLSDKDRMTKLDRDYMIVTTGSDNAASQKTITNNGGVFIADFYSEEMQLDRQVYHIPLKRGL